MKLPPPVAAVSDLDDLSNQANDAIRAGQWERAEALCAQLAKTFPEELDAEDRLAQLYQAQKNYPEALRHARAALDKALANPDKYHTDLVQSLEEQVDFLQKQPSP